MYLLTLAKRYLEARRRNQLRDEASRNVGKAAYVAEEVPRKKGDCYQWLKHGKCASGKDCPFLHDRDMAGKGRDSPTGSRRGSPRQNSPGSRSSGSSGNRSNSPKEMVRKDKNIPCTFFAQGKCKDGDKCKYRHAAVCTLFAKDGSCKFGDKCLFTHMKDGKAFVIKSNEQRGSRAKSPPGEPDAEGYAAAALPFRHPYEGVAFVATTSATDKKVTFGNCKIIADDLCREEI